MNKRIIILAIMLFLFGSMIMLYPYIAIWQNEKIANKVEIQYEEAVAEYSDEEIASIFNLMEAYNRDLAQSNLQLIAFFDPENISLDKRYMELPIKDKEIASCIISK